MALARGLGVDHKSHHPTPHIIKIRGPEIAARGEPVEMALAVLVVTVVPDDVQVVCLRDADAMPPGLRQCRHNAIVGRGIRYFP